MKQDRRRAWDAVATPRFMLRRSPRSLRACCSARCATHRFTHRGQPVIRRAGQSLIEILVTIAILVIGVFTVLRLFPIGFRMVTQTGNQSATQSLADDLAQTARNSSLAAPTGIVEREPISLNNGIPTGWFVPSLVFNPQGGSGFATFPSVPVDSLKQNTLVQNSLFMQRTVIGERIRLKGNGIASLPLFGPIYLGPGTNPSDAAVNAYLQVYDPQGYTEIPPTGAMTAPRQFQVYPNGSLAVSPFDPEYLAGLPRHYLISYRTMVGNNPLDVVDEPVDFPAQQNVDSSGQAFVQGLPLPGTVQLFRAFPKGDGTGGTYKLLDPYSGVIAVTPFVIQYPSAVTGTPIPYSVIAPDATLAMDYTTRDWQILRQDRDVPADGVIHLPINNLDVLDRAANPTLRVLVISLNDPTQQIAINQVVAPAAAPTAPGVNVRDGVVYIPTNGSWPGTPVRIYYAAYNAWAEQPTMAYASYTEAPRPPGYSGNNLSGPPGYRFFSLSLDPGNTANDDSSKAAFLGFTVADAGKTVNIDYQFDDLEGRFHSVIGQTARIEAQQVNGAPGTAQAVISYAGPYAVVRGGVTVPNIVINRVTGISLQARGVYLESGDVLRADDVDFGTLINTPTTQIWNYPVQNPPKMVGRLGEATEDVYVAH